MGILASTAVLFPGSRVLHIPWDPVPWIFASDNRQMETSPELTADGYLVPQGSVSERLDKIQDVCYRHGIRFPLVLKPDTAQRGAGFKKIQSLEEAEQYFAQVSAPLVLQRYVTGPREAGIFYCRLPRETRGHIFGIARKQFPAVTGDGTRTLRELVKADSRACLVAPTYLKRFGMEPERPQADCDQS
jgi:hypothetical protein